MNKLWIHATDFLNWLKPPVGTIRVEQKLIKWSLENLKEVGFFIYDFNGRFYAIDPSQVRAKLQLKQAEISKKLESRSETSFVRKSHFFKLPSLQDFKQPLSLLLSGFYRFLLTFIDSKHHQCVDKQIKKLRFQKPCSTQANYNLTHPFKPNDVILCVGGMWNFAPMIQDMNLIKESVSLKFYAFCHDLIPIKLPHLSLMDKLFFENYLSSLCQSVDHLFCVSQSTEKDLKEFLLKHHLKSRPSTSCVILGSDVFERESLPSDSIQKILREKYILYVSTIERRKNHACIYMAILYLLECGYKNLPKFVFVGSKEWKVNDFLDDLATDPRIKDHIIILSNISDAELSQLYKNSLFTVYPSFYEGWGLPVAESLAYGKFVIASCSSSLPEAGGGFADYVSPYDPAEWARRIKLYLDNPELLAKHEKKIRQQYSRNSWDTFCQNLYAGIHAKQSLEEKMNA